MIKPCYYCNADFQAAFKQLYCSIKCRRQMEFKRRKWDAQKRTIRFYTHNANLSSRTELQRQNWLAKAELVKEFLGDRP